MTAGTPPAPPAAPATLGDLIRAGEWRRAAATANVLGESADLVDALQTLRVVQDEIRARRYPAARQQLAAYREAAGTLTHPLAGDLRLYVHPDEVSRALDALEAQRRTDDPAALRAALEGALAQPLTRAEALNALGVLHAMLGDEAQAREALTAAREADPGHYRALTNLGNLDMEAGRFAEAEAIYREVLTLAPEYDGGHHNLGVAVRRQGRVAEGVRHIRQGQRLSMKRSREDTRAEAKEQLSRTPGLKYLRFLLLAAAALIIFLALRGAGG
ncbi:tetratricopeptide repeat protein [Deinococcus soli (ex Cha et al. 2016)]|uniref:Uncharacterized protein n=1 Tax=Deinococcus soli (ex Cha et al. 2016) TaxID=1309411 RepID=A0A0F7JS62_9DEIO|nr:tetratricopeptide repeat protein [Deinococcus soli (ex Cha et al. 2016)]AKH18179.1 hypothetical protein SY84_15425 [Deinococcus soli (ex Cha et al. 2016)]